ncbi:TrkH family potassium uptake protein [Aureispira anguillae]|uniref:TrkH family potassium uptake protein n=1 Tax=Aureispira anguillae TaxID=2864201 RepID=A0A915VMS0_9BACT|nr:potassium transporter TrkG [Aureispira anguillae]BDS09609.1 TrkH family potassium uptake protein [Aureispira anguillae]
MIDFGTISNVVGVLLISLGCFMLTALPFSWYHASGDALAIFYAACSTILVGGLSWLYKFKTKENVGKREGYLIVVIGWIAMSLFSMFPYLFSGVFTTFSDAIFESVSGLTTTGASVLNDIEAVPAGILFWRSLTQWIGGMGIIVLMVAIFPLLGIGGVELFVAEAPGSSLEKIHPRIKEIAKRLWLIYLGLTTLLTFILYGLGMTFFDAINHALTTMATGGFSTKNASIAYFTSPAIQYTLLIFMFLAGVNYTVLYYGLKGKFKKVWRSDEFKTYIFGVLFLTVAVTTTLYCVTDHGLEQSFRDAAFQIVSVITTTGFVSADYTSWTPALSLLFFFLLFVGACAGSTSGGIKLIRHLVFFKNSFLEFKRLLHPNAIIRIKIDNQIVSSRIITHILVFLLIYLMIFLFGSLIMVVILNDFDQPLLSAIGAVATSLGNVGPALADLSPVDNFAAVPPSGKCFLTILMLLGRLELFTILVVFTPYFWKAN